MKTARKIDPEVIAEAAMAKVFSRIVINAGGCLIWTGCINHGYGQVSINCRRYQVHRVVYTWAYGPIDSGMVLDHLCKVKRCANPLHLEAVTQSENLFRGEQGQKTHCKHGHEYTPENTVIKYNPGPKRNCRKCINLRRKKSRAAA